MKINGSNDEMLRAAAEQFGGKVSGISQFLHSALQMNVLPKSGKISCRTLTRSCSWRRRRWRVTRGPSWATWRSKRSTETGRRYGTEICHIDRLNGYFLCSYQLDLELDVFNLLVSGYMLLFQLNSILIDFVIILLLYSRGKCSKT